MNAARECLAEKIAQADAIVIGGGSGLSSAAGYDHYHWSPTLSEALVAFREHYGFRSPFDGFYYCYSSWEEQWGYYSQYIRFLWEAPTGQPYLDLKELVAGKPCFALTTNVDMQFGRIFPPEQLCTFQGDFSLCQCGQPCREHLDTTGDMVREMTRHLIDGVRLPAELVPRCPVCGRVMVPWVRDDAFLENGFWRRQVERYHSFLRRWLLEQPGKNVLLLELGVGEMTPSSIKLPFWRLTAENDQVFYACLNRKDAHAPEHLKGRSLYLSGDLAENLSELRRELTNETQQTREEHTDNG